MLYELRTSGPSGGCPAVILQTRSFLCKLANVYDLQAISGQLWPQTGE